jgi:2-Cys peroxiredoxin 5
MRASIKQLTKIQVGDKLPSANVFLGVPPAPTNFLERFGKGRVLVFGVPGAFTPGCSKTHLPGYVKDAEKIRAKLGVTEIVCIAVNDVFVMDAWSAQHDPKKSVTMVADAAADFAVKSGLKVDLPVLGGVRSSRFALVAEDGVVKHLFEEPDGKGLSCSLSDSILAKL